jgi:hypothetical protein
VRAIGIGFSHLKNFGNRLWQKYKIMTSALKFIPGVDVMITISTIFGKKIWRFSQKPLL